MEQEDRSGEDPQGDAPVEEMALEASSDGEVVQRSPAVLLTGPGLGDASQGRSAETEVEIQLEDAGNGSAMGQGHREASNALLDDVMPEEDTSGPVQPTPLPPLQTFALCMVLFSDALAITMLFPFLNQMVARFMGLEGEDDRQEVGYYSGYLASAFFLAQTLSSYFWGWVSEHPKVGKKRVLQIGMTATILSLLVFGFSVNYWMAMGARIVWGFCNSNFPTAKSVIYLMSDETNRAKGFSLVGFMWGFGSIVGPIIGGFFSEIVLKDSFPYALPCVMTCVLCVIALVTMSLFLKEPKAKGAQRSPYPLTPARSLLTRDSVEAANAAQVCDEDVGVELEDMAGKGETGEADTDAVEEEIAVDVSDLGSTQINATKTQKFKFFMARHWVLMVSIITYALVAFVVISFDELFPLWSINTLRNNGLAFSTFDIGVAWLCSGATLLVFQGYVYSKITSAFGALNVFQVGAVLGVIIIMAYPALAKPRECFGIEFWVVAAPVFSGRAIFASCMFTSSNILVANSSTIPIGKANGIAATVGGIMKGIGPAVTTNLFAWSSTSGYQFPLNYLAAFLMLAGLCIVSFWTSLVLPKRVGFLAMDE